MSYFECKLFESKHAAAQNDTSFFGPVAGRVAQRIARGRFVLDGKVYHLNINDGRNTLQGTHRAPARRISNWMFCSNQIQMICSFIQAAAEDSTKSSGR